MFELFRGIALQVETIVIDHDHIIVTIFDCGRNATALRSYITLNGILCLFHSFYEKLIYFVWKPTIKTIICCNGHQINPFSTGTKFLIDQELSHYTKENTFSDGEEPGVKSYEIKYR